MGTMVLSAIPVVNIILWFIWAFTARKPSRRTFAIAMLLLTLIAALLVTGGILAYGKEIVEWAKSLDPAAFVQETNLP